MNDIDKLLQNDNFARSLLNSLPCGILIVDEKGNVQAINNILKQVVGVTEQAVLGKGSGDALGCVRASEHPQGCGSEECCRNCEARLLALAALSKNKKQMARTNLQLNVNGQVRDVTLLLSAVPFTLKNKRFANLIIEDVSSLCLFSLPDIKAGFRGIVGQDQKMKDLIGTINQVARTDAPVLIQGESGTGKELVAIAIHEENPRAHKYFVPVNCGALPEGLIETDLFGHVKGAFTGAIRDKKGRFELADGGTIFLDEVSELSPAMQVKLLRVLQDGCFERVGSEKTVRVNVRVISATNKNLEEELTAGRFRPDLYYRLCVMPIFIYPLRDRLGDVPLLAEHFLALYTEESFGKKVSLSSAALSMLEAYSWPGNVRELENVLQFALAKCQGDVIEPGHLPPALHLNISRPFTRRRREPKLQAVDVTAALKKAGGNKRRTAEILGVSRSSLYRFFERQNSSRKAG
jgi:transcriptional regulator with PAS, ATPase and Fis domain